MKPSETASFGGLFMYLRFLAPFFLRLELTAIICCLWPVEFPFLVLGFADFSVCKLFFAEFPFLQKALHQLVAEAYGNSLFEIVLVSIIFNVKQTHGRIVLVQLKKHKQAAKAGGRGEQDGFRLHGKAGSSQQGVERKQVCSEQDANAQD